MKFYDLHTPFTFGQYQGKTLQDVIQKVGWHYIEWCILNLDHFVLSKEVFDIYAEYDVCEHIVLAANEAKLQEWMDEEDNDYLDEYDSDFGPEPDYERDTFYALTDGTCGDYDDFQSSGMDMDALRDSLGF